MKHWQKVVVILTTMIVFTSCIRDMVPVIYNSYYCDDHEVIIDGKINLRYDRFRQYKKIDIQEGEHYYQINKGPKIPFEVDEKGGIFNVAQEEFVIYPELFANDLYKNVIEPQNNYLSLGKPNIIQVDSFVVGSPRFFPNFEKKINRRFMKEVSDGSEKFQLQVHRKTQLFIPKTWEFDMRMEENEIRDALETAAVEVQIVGKRRVMNAKEFLIKMARNNNSDYKIVHLKDIKK